MAIWGLHSGAEARYLIQGAVIVDADLSAIKETVDGRPHPGLHNAKGHIGWLGHGCRMDWRHIRIKEVPADYSPARSADTTRTIPAKRW